MNYTLAAKVFANWTMLYFFLSGFSVIMFSMFVPNILSKKYDNYLTAMTIVATQTPPYSWVGISANQMWFVMLAVDAVKIIALLSFPKLSGGLTLIGLAQRQFFLRYNEDNPGLPNSPLCAYKSPHCGVMDAVHLLIGICAAFVFMSERPLPELTTKFLNSMGIQAPSWSEGWRQGFRKIVPEYIQHELPAKTSAESTRVSEAARKNI